MQPTQLPNTIVTDRASKRKDSCSERVSQFGTAGVAIQRMMYYGEVSRRLAKLLADAGYKVPVKH